MNQTIPARTKERPSVEKCIRVFPSRKRRCPKDAREAYSAKNLEELHIKNIFYK